MKIGDVVAKFSLAGTNRVQFVLPNKQTKNWQVLFFYPRDATPGCTIEGHEFTQLQKQFAKLGVDVFGVSRDSLASHEKFKAKECYTIELLSDESEEVCELFEVIKDKNMYGKKVKGIERSTFVFKPDGTLLMEWRKVKAEGHAAEVLAWIKANK